MITGIPQLQRMCVIVFSSKLSPLRLCRLATSKTKTGLASVSRLSNLACILEELLSFVKSFVQFCFELFDGKLHH